MNLDQRQDLSLQQHLHLTPELRQGIAVLQMSALDLSAYVKTCVEENPFLDDDDWEEPRHQVSPECYTPNVSSDALFEKRGHGSPEKFGNERTDMSQRSFSFDRFLVEGKSLNRYLLEQLDMMAKSQSDRVIGEYLIGNIDDSGYLRVDTEDAARDMNIDEREIVQVLELIQGFQPTGVAARNLAECLTLQIESREEMTPAIKCFIDEHLSEFETKTPAAIARSMGIGLAELNEYLNVVHACNPRPASQFGTNSSPIWPEVVVRAAGDGGYDVELQDFYLPHLKINAYYRTLAAGTDDSEAMPYLKEKLREAESLIDGISYRRLTLYKVACCIVEMEVEFFDKGFDFLRPLTMAQIAGAVDLSESTISRVSNGNYMQTPRGVFELRYFFHSSVTSSSNRTVSSVSVKHRISDIVANEDHRHPLSDQAISETLVGFGVSISRRTVTKYREQLRIPSCAMRKRS